MIKHLSCKYSASAKKVSVTRMWANYQSLNTIRCTQEEKKLSSTKAITDNTSNPPFPGLSSCHVPHTIYYHE